MAKQMREYKKRINLVMVFCKKKAVIQEWESFQVFNGKDGKQITVPTFRSIEANIEMTIETGSEYSNGGMVSYLVVFGKMIR